MTETRTPHPRVSLVVEVELLDAGRGGLSQAISSGYRPLCVVRTSDRTDVVIGLCELQLDADLAPGSSAEAKLIFDGDVADGVRRYLGVGSRFALAEGRREIGTAEVKHFDN